MRTFTVEELSQYDGKEGRAAYIAYGGKVYDVSRSFLWRGGRHQVVHLAGMDLTSALRRAPHGADVLKSFPVIGILVTAPTRKS